MRGISILLTCACLWAADNPALRDLAERHRFFELERALEQPAVTGEEGVFYRGMTSSRFGHEAEGAELLRTFLATRPDSELARQAREEIVSGEQRLGHYREAADALSEGLKLMPLADSDREETQNTQLLMESLRDVLPTSAEFGADVSVRAVRNKLGSWNVPVEVNGAKGEWIFDTGANYSTIVESEAKRMGLEVRQSSAYVSGSTDKHNSLQVAIAKEVVFGGAHIHNVVFLVLADEALRVAPVHYQIAGILGLPAIRALGRVGIARDGRMEIGARGSAAAGPANLYFEEMSPVVEIEHEGRLLQMHLDTGANDTTLYPGFRDALSQAEKAHIRRTSDMVGGAGGTIKRKIESVPQIRIGIGGKEVVLKKLSLVGEVPSGKRRYFDGVIGMDALWGGFVVDFGAMRIEVQQ